MRLRTKFALVLLLVTVVLSGSVYGGLELYKASLVQETRDDVNETAALTARQLDQSIGDRKDFVGFVASRPSAARFEESDRFLSSFVDNSRFFAAQLVDRNGTIVDFHGDVTLELREESIGADVGDRPYVSRALQGEVYVSGPEFANSTGQYLVVYSAPVFAGREIEGVLAAAIYLDSQTAFGVLRPISRADQRVTVTAGTVTLYASGERFAKRIEATRTVESTGWTVTVVRDRSDLLARLRGLAIAQGIGLLVVLLSAVSFGVWEYRTTLAQTRKLLEGFRALEAGSYDHDLSLAAAEEWEQISEGFNALASSLAAREAELSQREQRLQVLNRVLRHNLRNSVAVVLGYAEIVQEEADDDGIGDAAARIEETTIELQALSEKARELEYTMTERGEPRRLDASAIVSDTLAEIRARYPDVEVTATLPEEAWVLADPSIRLAVGNLCENACEHNQSPTPRLEVRVEPTGSTVRIEVADDAGGIPDHERAVIEGGEETPLDHGSGLGLWIVQWAVEQSDGTLAFDVDESVATTATIELPRAGSDGPEGGETVDG